MNSDLVGAIMFDLPLSNQGNRRAKQKSSAVVGWRAALSPTA